MKQLELSIWDNAIDKKRLEIKQAKLERRNEWIRNNLKNYQHEFNEPNLKGMKWNKKPKK